ncbi:MAG: response regulator [Planctomycetes bacterium]|nr:response regulator [Planctomycetota bacterium]
MNTTLLRAGEGGSPATTSRPCVLLVDDEDALRMTLTRELHKQGFVVYSTASGAEAVEMFCRSTARIDLVLMDVNTPGMSWSDTLSIMRLVDPAVVCCMMTANTQPSDVAVNPNRDDAAVFRKPFDSIPALCDRLRHLACERSSQA